MRLTLSLLAVLTLTTACASSNAPEGRAYSERVLHLPPDTRLVDQSPPARTEPDSPKATGAR